MIKVNKKQIKIRKVVSIFVVCIVLLLSFYFLLGREQLFFFEKLIKDSFTAVNRLIAGSSNENILSDSYLLELQEEVKQLKEMTNIENIYSEFDTLNATVIVRDGAYWFDIVTIDKGSKNGVSVGDAIVDSNGLIGKVSKVSYYTSEVTLITDDKNKVALKKDDFNALTKGYIKDTDCVLVEAISNVANINENDILTTSGLGTIYPSGIVVGYVASIRDNSETGLKDICLKTKVNFNKLRYVTILRKEKIKYEE